MDELIAAFRSAYPAHANTAWLLGLAQPALPDQRALFAMAESDALSGRRAEAVDRARALTRPLLIAPGQHDVVLDALVTIGGAALEVRDGEERRRVRQVVEMLLDVAQQYPHSPLWRPVNARAALLHARVDDRVLAASRLRDWEGAAPPAGVVEDGHDVVRVAAARRLLGMEQGRDADGEHLPMAAHWDSLGRLARLVLMDLDPSATTDGLTASIGSSALDNADMTVREVATAIIDVRASVGPVDTLLRHARPLLLQAEEAVWLAPAPRPALWARLAAAAGAVGLRELVDRWTTAALEELGAAPPPPPAPLVDVLADLVRAASYETLTWNPDVGATAAEEPAPTVHPDPVPVVFPPTLTDVLRSGNVLLVAGPELPEARGAPGRTALLARLVEEMADPSIGDDARRGAQLALSQGSLDLAARVLRATNEPVMTKVFEAYSEPPANDAYDYLAQVSFTGLVNMSWDGALLDAFAHRSPVVVHSQSDQVFTAAKTQEFAFTWFAGDPATEQIAISSNEVRSRFYADENLSRFLTGAVQSSSLLFVGVRASDVIEFFDALPASGGPPSAQVPASSSSNAIGTSPGDTQHHAICLIDDLWSLNERELRSRGVVPIGYRAGDGVLAEAIRQLSYLARPVGPGDAPPLPPTSPSMLSRIMLTNIGAFDTLDLSLSPVWNLLLGNNGCGKSTVLRAVALGLCGDHPRAIEAGEGLLRAGCDSGAIELQVGASRFRTELTRSSGTVRVRTTSLTPLQQGNWAVLGFPALRGMSLTTPSGISSTQAPEPRVEDLLPLLLDEVDHRLDDIKQWIVNVEARARQTDGDADRWRGLLDRFFAVLTELTPGSTLEFASVDPSSWEVWVRTDDGIVSIDQLSQGMSSIIAWVGTLLQRMYDIYPASPEPAAEGAFVLIDELDAHLHPAWQRLLPSLTRKHFPQVQYLATSHSPLVASGLQAGELFVATREPRLRPDGTEQLVATIALADIDPQGLRADQILTSPLFGLMTSRSPEHHRDVDRYSELYVKQHRTAEEEAELARLRGTLANAYRDGETVAEREADSTADGEIAAALAQHPDVGGPDARQRAADAFADVEDAP